MRRHYATAALCCLLSACQPQPAPDAESPAIAPDEWPPYDYAAAAAGGATVFRLEPGSRIEIVVRRDGPLARFGHDHVITANELEGVLLLEDPEESSRADLRFRTDRLLVDEEEARARFGLDTEPDQAAIDGTRENLESRVLERDRWPWVSIHLSEFREDGEEFTAGIEVQLRDHRHRWRESFRLERRGKAITVNGSFTLSQADLGLEPFSVLGGGLRVADALEIHVQLRGVPLGPD